MPSSNVSQLYRKHAPLLYSRCRRLLRDDVLAADAVQEVFVRMLPYLETLTDEEEAQALGLRISTNLCLDWMRRRRWEEPVEGVPDREGADLAEQLADRDYLFQLLARTPEKLREVAVLHHLDGLSQEKIARVLDISARTVFTRLQQFQERVAALRGKEGAA